MATLDLYVNIQTRELVRSFTETAVETLPPFYGGDTGLVLRIHPLKPSSVTDPVRPFEYISPGSSSLAIGLGNKDEPPTAGTFSLIDPDTRATSGMLIIGRRYYIEDFNSGDSFTNVGAASNATGQIFTASGTTPTTWTNSSTLVQISDALAYNIAAAALQTALQANLTNYATATVTGDAGGPWTIDCVAVGEVDALEGIGVLLSPDSFVGVSQLRVGTDALSKRQRVRLLQRPAAYAVTMTYFDSYTTINATERRAGVVGGNGYNEIQRISLPRDTYGGVWQLTSTVLGAANNETKATGNIAFGLTGDEVETIINEAWGATNVVSVTKLDEFTFDIEYTGTDVLKKNLAVAVANIAGLDVPVGWIAEFNLNTSGVVDTLGSSDEEEVTFELEQTDGDEITTLYQGIASLVNDLIDPEATGATEFPGFYTAPQVDALLDLLTQRGAASISAAGTTEVTVVAGCKWLTYRVTVAAGAGAYTHNFDLAAISADRNAGDTVKVVLDMPASANPIVTVRDNTSPTTLYTETSSGFAYVRVLFFSWTGTAWESDQGAS